MATEQEVIRIVGELQGAVTLLKNTLGSGYNPNDAKTQKSLLDQYGNLVQYLQKLDLPETPQLRNVVGAILKIFERNFKEKDGKPEGAFISGDDKIDILDHCNAILTVRSWARKAVA